MSARRPYQLPRSQSRTNTARGRRVRHVSKHHVTLFTFAVPRSNSEVVERYLLIIIIIIIFYYRRLTMFRSYSRAHGVFAPIRSAVPVEFETTTRRRSIDRRLVSISRYRPASTKYTHTLRPDAECPSSGEASRSFFRRIVPSEQNGIIGSKSEVVDVEPLISTEFTVTRNERIIW